MKIKTAPRASRVDATKIVAIAEAANTAAPRKKSTGKVSPPRAIQTGASKRADKSRAEKDILELPSLPTDLAAQLRKAVEDWRKRRQVLTDVLSQVAQHCLDNALDRAQGAQIIAKALGLPGSLRSADRDLCNRWQYVAGLCHVPAMPSKASAGRAGGAVKARAADAAPKPAKTPQDSRVVATQPQAPSPQVDAACVAYLAQRDVRTVAAMIVAAHKEEDVRRVIEHLIDMLAS